MAEKNEIWEDLNELLSGYHEQKNQIYACYQKLVTSIISGSITSEREIRDLMDSLGDFCDEERFFVLYQDLCRCINKNRPEMFGEYKHIFSMQL